MPLRDIGLALLAVTFWGLNFTVIKISLAELPPVLTAALRFFFAAVPAVFFTRRPQGRWPLVIGYALAMGVTLYALLNISIYLGLPAGLASIVLQAQALFTIIFAALVFAERPRLTQLAGIALAFGGIGIIAWSHAQGASLVPFALVVIAAIAWAVANILSKRAGQIDMIGFTVWGNLLASGPLLLLALVIDGTDRVMLALSHPSWNMAALVAFQAYPTTLFGFAVWSSLLKRHPTALVAPFTLLVPVVGMAAGVLVLGERLEAVDLFGGLLVLAGLALSIVRRRAGPLEASAVTSGG